MRSLRLSQFVSALVVTGALVVAPSRAATTVGYRVIVNPANANTTVEHRFLAEAFLKKTTRWPDGSLIRPVDQGADAPARQRFSEDVLGRSVAAVRSYWQQMVFAGRNLPPPELDGDDDVVRYVLKNAGALGYVSGAANVERVRVVIVK
jgi:hypothetical protein